MDFRNCPWECEPKHKWTINIIDRHTKFVNVHTIHNKLANEGLNEVQKNCVTYGYPTPHKKKKLLHGAARTPRTQGLVKRSNRAFKENNENLDNEHMWSPNFPMVQVHNAIFLHHEHVLSSCYQHDTI